MELLGDVGDVESHFGTFGGSVSVSARYIHRNHFGSTPMVLLGDVGHVESHFSPFGDCVSFGAR
jgi:hypothetical protein